METISLASMDREDDSGIDTGSGSDTSTVYIRISLPDLKLQKCLQFNSDDLIWFAKQRVLATMAKNLRDGLNYGLYCPPMNGRAGKFLDEERALKDYPLNGPIGFLEFKYKRRVYKMMSLNARRLKQIHTKSNFRHFLDATRRGEIDKIMKFTNKGLDPNFHDNEAGETPLSLAVGLKKSRDTIIALVSGGAHLDFRARDGRTPVHRAAQLGNYDAMKTLLDLGSSSNYKDANGVTPLYLACSRRANPMCVEILLHDHAQPGAIDDQAWTEVHQVCKFGGVQHLEHLLFYGAEMNARNNSGNTPLHVCAINNQESCARVLLFRGADKTLLNYSNQTATQVAIIAGNTELSLILRDFSSDQVVPFQEMPRYNEKRRCMFAPLQGMLTRSRSDPRLHTIDSGSNSYINKARRGSATPFTHNQYESDGAGGLMLHKSLNMNYDSDSPTRSMSLSSTGSLSGSYASLPGEPILSGETNHVEDRPRGIGGGYHGGLIPSHEELSNLNLNSSLLRKLCVESNFSPRKVVLQKGRQGFGFVLRGARSQQTASSVLDFTPSVEFPALQYLDRVDKGSNADKAGLKQGDFLLEINDQDVVSATHERTVDIIKGSGDTLALKVVTVMPSSKPTKLETHVDGTRTLPVKRKVPRPPLRDPKTSLTLTRLQRAQATCNGVAGLDPLEFSNRSGSIDLNTPVLPPSAAAAPAKKSPPVLASPPQGWNTISSPRIREWDKSGYLDSQARRRGVDPQNKVASIRARTAQKRVTAVELADIFDRQGMGVPPVTPPSIQSPQQHSSLAYGNLERTKSVPSLVAENRLLGNHVQRQISAEAESYSGRIIATAEVHETGSLRSTKRPPGLTNTQSPPVRYNSLDNLLSQKVPVKSTNVAATEDAVPIETAPAPAEAPPAPPDVTTIPPRRRGSEVICINTREPHTYANVSAEIAAKLNATPYESSFRPGKEARITSEPKIKAQAQVLRKAAPPVQGMVIPPPLENEYYEPEPDYDTVPADGEDVADSAAQVYQNESSASVAKQDTVKPHAVAPSVEAAANNKMSAFEEAIKSAALARETRQQKQMLSPKPDESNKKQSVNHSPSPTAPAKIKTAVSPASTSNGVAAAESEEQTQSVAPPPPPQLPPPFVPTTKANPQNTEPSPQPKAVSPAVAKQLQETKQREESHAALMAAIAKRRALLDNSGSDTVAQKIENQMGKPQVKKSYFAKGSTPPPPVAVKATKKEPGTATASDAQTAKGNFTEAAERMRQQYLQKHNNKPAEISSSNNAVKKSLAKEMPATPPKPIASQASASDIIARAEKPKSQQIFFGGKQNSEPVKAPPVAKEDVVKSHGQKFEQLSLNKDAPSAGVPPPPNEFGNPEANTVGFLLSSSPPSVAMSPLSPPSGFDAGDDEIGVPMGFEDVLPPSGFGDATTESAENKHISDWSVVDVSDWLQSLGLSEHVTRFKQKQVSGRQLAAMGRNELIQLGVHQVGQRMNLERAIKKAKLTK